MAASLGTVRSTVYDMDTGKSWAGPDLPHAANHIAGCVSPKGVLHVTGGYLQDGKEGLSCTWRVQLEGDKASDMHYSWDLESDTSEFVQEKSMPFRRGGHGCAFIDSNMYCVGGGQDQMGPFESSLMIYNSETKTWSLGPECPTKRDHVYATVVCPTQARMKRTAHRFTGQLLAIGGRTTRDHVAKLKLGVGHFEATGANEVYNPATKLWTKRAALPYPRAATHVLEYHRRLGQPPNVLAIGGEVHDHFSGHTLGMMEEYDAATDLWYCWPPLKHSYFGGGVGIDTRGMLHVVGGGEAFAISASRRVQVVDLPSAPLPVPCMYEPVLVQFWNSTMNKVLSYPYHFERESPQLLLV
eukprot:scaffold140_cov565-Prasinococcus_capsulatus_cf.AAC.24